MKLKIDKEIEYDFSKIEEYFNNWLSENDPLLIEDDKDYLKRRYLENVIKSLTPSERRLLYLYIEIGVGEMKKYFKCSRTYLNEYLKKIKNKFDKELWKQLSAY